MSDLKVYNIFYLEKLWIITLFITPLLFIAQNVFENSTGFLNVQSWGEFFEFYIWFIIISLIFSLPVGVVSLILCKTLIDHEVRPLLVKAIVLSAVVIGIFTTFYLILNTFTWQFGGLYSGVVIVIGLLLRVTPRY